MVGIGTALADDPMLTCRLPGMARSYSPVRVVLDSALRLPLGSRLARTAREVPVWVVDREPRPARCARCFGGRGSRDSPGAAAARDGSIIAAVLKLIAERGITRLMVEGGPTLAAAFLTADLVDEAVCSSHQRSWAPMASTRLTACRLPR